MHVTLGQLAEKIGAAFTGDASMAITRLATLQDAVAGDISFLHNARYERLLATTGASAVIVAHGQQVEREGLAILRVKDPYAAFVGLLLFFHPPRRRGVRGIHPSAVIADGARIDGDATVAALASIGARSVIGRGTVILEGTVVGEDVTIGTDCLIHPNASILQGTMIGDRVIIHAGATIGSDGFGFAPSGSGYIKIPQVGHVRIEDDVEIGANSTIDRGTLGPTIIRRGVKLDNLIQIAHNVEIGEDTVIAAQSGIAGSTTIGKHVLMGGQVGVVGHIEIGDHVSIGAQAGIGKSLSGEGKVFRGSPAREIREELRLEATMRRLPELLATIRRLESELAALKETRKA
jgi:UDP-3-O-[3-hydroxymyristoyl] glucosamine N-acyltransferase